jgi:Phosphotransferase enzyme family
MGDKYSSTCGHAVPDEISKTWQRCIIVKKDTVVKIELSENDLTHLKTGEVIYPYWAKERLRNEAATLRFIKANTSIPVPTCRLFTEEGLLHLDMERITNGVLLMDVKPELRKAAIQAVEEQMNSTILPQLRSLRRKFIGSIDTSIAVFPPQRVYGLDRGQWPQISSETDEFTFCHNDLGPQNIFVDPSRNFQIIGIIDWEFSGYFPLHFELPLWREFEWRGAQRMHDEARPRALEFFGLMQDDLQDDRVVIHHTRRA